MKDKKIKKIESGIEEAQKGIEALQKQLNELKEPKFEVGKWYKFKDNSNWLIFASKLKDGNYGFNRNGDWSTTLGHLYKDQYIRATDQEVETALVAEAKRRGFKGGCNINNSMLDMCSNESCYPDDCKFEYQTEMYKGFLSLGGMMIFGNGQWAEIIESTDSLHSTVTINGYEMKQEGDVIAFGCAKFDKFWLQALCDACLKMKSNCQTNRHPTLITLDSGVEITVEDLKKICDNIK